MASKSSISAAYGVIKGSSVCRHSVFIQCLHVKRKEKLRCSFRAYLLQIWGLFLTALGLISYSFGAHLLQLWGSFFTALGLICYSFGAHLLQLWGSFAVVTCLWLYAIVCVFSGQLVIFDNFGLSFVWQAPQGPQQVPVDSYFQMWDLSLSVSDWPVDSFLQVWDLSLSVSDLKNPVGA